MASSMSACTASKVFDYERKSESQILELRSRDTGNQNWRFGGPNEVIETDRISCLRRISSWYLVRNTTSSSTPSK